MSDGYTYTAEERETVIVFNEKDSTARVCTANRAMYNNLKSLSEELPDECKCVNDDEVFPVFIVPKKWVKIRKPKQMSEENIEKARERMKSLRNSRNEDEAL